MKNAQVVLSKHAERMMPFESEVTEEGECVSFNIKQLVKVLIFHVCWIMLEETDY